MEEPAYQHTSEMRLLAVIVIPYKFYEIHGWRSFHARKAEAPTELDYQNGQEERRLSQLCGHFCNSTAEVQDSKSQHQADLNFKNDFQKPVWLNLLTKWSFFLRGDLHDNSRDICTAL